MEQESKRAKFERLADKRVDAALKKIKVIGNLSVRGSYEYSDDDVIKIFNTLQNALDQAKGRFKLKDKSFHIGGDN